MPATAQDDLYERAEAIYWARVQKARTDLATFIEFCGRNEEGGPLVLDYIHKAWIWHVNYCWSRGLRAGICAPWGSGKSSCLAVPLSTFIVGNNPQVRLKFISNADPFAARRVAAAKMILETPEFKHVFPEIKKGRRWTEHELEVKRKGNALDATLHARGVMTQGVGLRADVEIFDDVVDQKNSMEAASRKKVIEFVHQTWLSRLDQTNGRALWISTPWAAGDCTEDLMHTTGWCFLVQRVSQDLEHYDQEVFGAEDDYLTDMVAPP